ncbi:ATP-binding cassette domain-containing protein [Lacticaseibacillus absianus]|uniref:ATP-binding cassette domain-containing protein n=1 Tax=Lacticaseibacillus absianus TaxID=2729623 RepID=UPI0015C83A96|nr:ABC transporter ATP-binding protein [Lacticaseibacillus absianus]
MTTNYLRQQRTRLLGYLLLVPVAALAEVSVSWVLRLITDVVTHKSPLSFTALCAIVLSYMLVSNGINFIRNMQRSKLLTQATRNLRATLFAVLGHLALHQFNTDGQGTHLARFGQEAEMVERQYYGSLLNGYYLAWQLGIALIGTLLLDVRVMLVVLVLSLPAFFVPKLTQHATEVAQGRVMTATEAFTARVADLANGYATLRLNLAQTRFGRLFAHDAQALATDTVAYNRVLKSINALQNLLNDLQYLGTWVVGGYFVMQGTLTLGDLVAFSQLMIFVSYPLFELVSLVSDYQAGRAVKGRLDAIVTSVPPVAATPALAPVHTIRYAHVGVQVAGQTLLHDVNLTLDTTAKTLIVGASGSGKSTLVRLLFGYYPAISGQLTLDGRAVDTLTLDQVASQIAYVPQSTYVFTADLAANTTLFAPQPAATVTAALQAAGLGDWVTQRDQALAQPLSQADTALSGGERQRLALARAALQPRPYTIYDELTTGLDPQIAASIEATVFAQRAGCAFITHRYNPELFAAADQIVCLAAGRIQAAGPLSAPAVQQALAALHLN